MLNIAEYAALIKMFCFKLNIADYAALIKVCFVLSVILLTMLH